jgi:hypothetical protein
MAIYKVPGIPAESSSVKSVQRGVVGSAFNVYNQNIAINISPVNPSKCLVTLSGGVTYAGSTFANNQIAQVAGLTATVLTVNNGVYYSSSNYYGQPYAWQIVEFN